jgi:hypothetical protein
MLLLLMSANLMFSIQPASNVEDPEVLLVQEGPLLGAQEGPVDLEDLAQPPEVAVKKKVGLAVQVQVQVQVQAASQEAVLVVPVGQALFVPVDPVVLAILDHRVAHKPVGQGLEVRVPRKPFHKRAAGKDMIAGNPA